jgi:VWFA-related protein
MTSCRSILFFCALALPAVGLSQQNSSPSSGPGSGQPGAAIRTQANLVVVDVVVTDSGKPADGLAQRQFHVFEDGKEQKIGAFEEHRAGDAPEAGSAPALPPHVYSDAPQFAMASAANVLLLDALNTPLTDQQYVRRQMLAYLRRLPKGTRLAVFTLASRLQMLEGFTTADAVEAAITHGRGQGEPSAVLESPQDVDTENGVAASLSEVDEGAMQQFVADTQAYRTDLRVKMTLDAFEELGRYLSAIPGRKNLIWFSGSFPLDLNPDASRDPLQGSTPGSTAQTALLDPLSTMRDYSAEVRATDDLLTAARVAVYPVDARGLMLQASVDVSRDFAAASALPGAGGAGSGSGGSGGGRGTRGLANQGGPVGSGGANARKAETQFARETIVEHQTMQQIAEETGGEAFVNTNDLREALARATEHGSNYYTLAYVPDAKRWDGRFHTIEVRVDGGRYDLAYRRGYYADDAREEKAASKVGNGPMVTAMERGAPPLAQIAFEARLLAASDPAAKAERPSAGPAGDLAKSLRAPVERYLADFSVNPRGLTWTALPNNEAHAEVELSMVAWGADGTRLNYTDRGLGVNLTVAQSEQALRTGLPIHEEIDLPAGRVYLRVAVHDLTSGRIGSTEIPLTVERK